MHTTIGFILEQEEIMDKVIAVRGKLIQRQWYSLQGTLLRAFEVTNSKGKMLAIGAIPAGNDAGFCVMHAKRYQRDSDLVQAITRLTGITPRV